MEMVRARVLPSRRASSDHSPCLPRLPLPHAEPEPQGPAPDLEIWKADFAGE